MLSRPDGRHECMYTLGRPSPTHPHAHKALSAESTALQRLPETVGPGFDVRLTLSLWHTDVSRVILDVMSTVTIRDLRNNSAAVMERIRHGEHLTVTKDGQPVAELHPTHAAPQHISALIQSARNLPPVDVTTLRADIDDLLDSTL